MELKEDEIIIVLWKKLVFDVEGILGFGVLLDVLVGVNFVLEV